MQNDFVDPEGYCPCLTGVSAEAIEEVRRIIPRIQRLREWASQASIPVVYTRESHLADLSDLPASKKRRYENAGYPVASSGPMGRFLVRGEAGNAIIHELTPHPADWQIDKPAHSIFVGTDSGIPPQTARRDAFAADRGDYPMLRSGELPPCQRSWLFRAAAFGLLRGV